MSRAMWIGLFVLTVGGWFVTDAFRARELPPGSMENGSAASQGLDSPAEPEPSSPTRVRPPSREPIEVTRGPARAIAAARPRALAIELDEDGLPTLMTDDPVVRRALVEHFSPPELGANYRAIFVLSPEHAKADLATQRDEFERRLWVYSDDVALRSEQLEALGDRTDERAEAERKRLQAWIHMFEESIRLTRAHLEATAT